MMTPEQEHTFVKVAQAGVACGLSHPYEWWENHVVHMADITGDYDKVLDAFIAFFRGTESMPDDPIANLTREEFITHVYQWYGRKEEEKRDL